MEFIVIFSPVLNEYYNRIAYCEITGKIERLSVGFLGSGRGPQVVFNVASLNINDIFIQATHDYHVVVKNTSKSVSKIYQTLFI